MNKSPLAINIVIVALGVLFIIMAFFATGVRGALSRGPTRPPTLLDRGVFFVIGLAALWKGLFGLLK
jgi:hypothetical protein